jgi:site-specific recombinase XerD
MGGSQPTARIAAASRRKNTKKDFTPSNGKPRDESLLLRRDRALLELLYAADLRVSELTGLDLVDIEQKERVLRVCGKGNKERIVPYGTKAQEALDKYWPLREALLLQTSGGYASRFATPHSAAVFLNYAGAPSYPAFRRPHRKKIRAPRKYELGFASALAASRLRHPSFG